MKNTLAIIIDNLSISLLIGIIAYSWCQFYIHSVCISALIALIFFASAILICWLITKEITKKQKLNKQAKENINAISEKLQFLSADKQILWLKQSIYQDLEVEIKTNFIYYDKKIIYNALTYDNLNQNDFYKIMQEITLYYSPYDFEKIEILCSSFSKELLTYVKSLNICVVLTNKVSAIQKYKLCAFSLPCDIKIVCPVKNYKYFIEYALSPARTKSYLLLGIILVLSSFFVIYKLYYLIFGTMLLVLSIITLSKHLKAKNNSA